MSSTFKLFFTIVVSVLIAVSIYGAVTGAEQKATARRNSMMKTVPADL